MEQPFSNLCTPYRGGVTVLCTNSTFPALDFWLSLSSQRFRLRVKRIVERIFENCYNKMKWQCSHARNVFRKRVSSWQQTSMKQFKHKSHRVNGGAYVKPCCIALSFDTLAHKIAFEIEENGERESFWGAIHFVPHLPSIQNNPVELHFKHTYCWLQWLHT